MDRITRENVDERAANLNRRMEHVGSKWRYRVEGRYNYIALDRVEAETGAHRDTVRTGSKREIAEFLHAMMVALDDAEMKA